jgi:hypothetical protein
VRAGGDDAVVEDETLRLAGRRCHGQGMGVLEHAAPVDLGDAVFAHQEVDTLDAARGDVAAAGVGDLVIEGHGRCGPDTERLGLVRENVGELGVAQQSLRRDAADVQAHSAPVALLDDRDRPAELRGPDGGHVPAHASAEHDEVEVPTHTSTLRTRPPPRDQDLARLLQPGGTLASRDRPSPARLVT